MADHSKIGKEYPPFTWVVEKGKIRELVQAIGDKNPIYQDTDVAKSDGYDDTPASPTFITLPMMWNEILIKIIADLNIDYLHNTLHGGEEYEYHHEIYPGDVLEGCSKIKGIVEKAGKVKMNFITIETTFTNQNNQKVVTATNVIIERE